MKTESASLGERQHIAFMQRQQICQAYLEVPILYSRTIAGILASCGESHVPIAEREMLLLRVAALPVFSEALREPLMLSSGEPTH